MSADNTPDRIERLERERDEAREVARRMRRALGRRVPFDDDERDEWKVCGTFISIWDKEDAS